MPRTVERRHPAGGVEQRLTQYLSLTTEAKALNTRAGEIKRDLLSFVAEHGEPDEKGHLLHTLSFPVKVAGTAFRGFMRQRRVSQSFDADAAAALCEAKGFAREDYITTTEYVDQDKVARLYAEDRISEAEFDALITESVTYAFVPVKD